MSGDGGKWCSRREILTGIDKILYLPSPVYVARPHLSTKHPSCLGTSALIPKLILLGPSIFRRRTPLYILNHTPQHWTTELVKLPPGCLVAACLLNAIYAGGQMISIRGYSGDEIWDLAWMCLAKLYCTSGVHLKGSLGKWRWNGSI